jgi:hypothetical protein
LYEICIYMMFRRYVQPHASAFIFKPSSLDGYIFRYVFYEKRVQGFGVET